MAEIHKHILVIVQTSTAQRTSEALRAALGLCLRGDHIHVLIEKSAQPFVENNHAMISRSLATLRELGHRVSPPGQLHTALRSADVIECWT